MEENLPLFITQEQTVQAHECGPDGYLKLNCMMDYFQDIAARHAELLHIGMEDLQAQHQLWVLSRLKLRFHRYPKIDEQLTMMTYPTGLNKLFATRQYQLIDRNGTICVAGTSFWIVIDDQKFRPVRPMKMLGKFSELNQDKPRFYADLDKITAPDVPPEKQLEYTVLQSNIDLNRHLNNAYYGAFIVDTLGILSGKLCHPQELQVNFLLPGALNAKINCCGKINADGTFYVEGRDPEGQKLYFQSAGNL